jgi:hypothetical protein
MEGTLRAAALSALLARTQFQANASVLLAPIEVFTEEELVFEESEHGWRTTP